ncbi:MAG: 4-alpha-glucanotransferase, partial [Nitriliruptorales bacterium]|nr:4-alpha-glucanotransferase [Nitriliruptorales bacterium]
MPGYNDAFGNWTEVPVEVQRQLVRAMDADPDAPGPPADDHVHVVRRGAPLPVDAAAELELEQGGRTSVVGIVPHDLPFGYHDLLVPGEDQPRRLIVGPGTAWLPDDLRTWGWATQLYALRSSDSWGIGDLADLRRLGVWSRSLGAGTVLVNPLDAVNPEVPRETSPYYPSTRRWRDPIYLRIEEVPGASDVQQVAALGSRLRGAEDRTIDRDRIYDAKMEALAAIWERRVDDEPRFEEFVREHRRSLEHFAVFMSLVEHFG